MKGLARIGVGMALCSGLAATVRAQMPPEVRETI